MKGRGLRRAMGGASLCGWWLVVMMMLQIINSVMIIYVLGVSV